MEAAEFRVHCEFLGFSVTHVAQIFDVQERSAQRWIYGSSPVPEGVVEELKKIQGDAQDRVDKYVTDLTGVENPRLGTYFRDEVMFRDLQVPYPASWHRAIVARVWRKIDGLEIYEIK